MPSQWFSMAKISKSQAANFTIDNSLASRADYEQATSSFNTHDTIGKEREGKKWNKLQERVFSIKICGPIFPRRKD